MKQKYVISKDNDKKALIIKEYTELDKEILSFVCEQAYDLNAIKSAIKKSKKDLISTLRTDDVYPIGIFAEKLADAVIDLLGSKDDQPIELFFNDIDLLKKERKAVKVEDDIENDAVEIDELLDGDESVPTFDEKDELSKLTRSIKVADDDSVDVDNES